MNPDFGMPDFTNMTANRMALLASSIQEIINAYEPRLVDVHVAFIESLDDPFSYSFSVSAILLVEDGEPSGITFQTIVNGEGNCTVE